MSPHRSEPSLTVRTEGGLLPGALLSRLAAGDRDLPGLDAKASHLIGERLGEAASP